MSLKIEKATESIVKRLPLPESREVTYTILSPTGLTLRVRSGGSKTWYARLWNAKSQRLVRKKLGVWPHMSCSVAIKAVERTRREFEESRWNDKLKALTLAQAYQHYKDKKAKDGKITSFQQQIVQAWRCVPSRLHHELLDEIVPNDLADLVSSVAAERKGTAFHVRRMLKAVYRLALINDWCLKDRTLTIEPVTLKPKRLLVSNEDIAKVLDTARQHPDKEKVCALPLTAATGQRGGEVMKLDWSDVYEDRIVFPAEIRKQGEEHTVWLNDLAREALATHPRSEANDPNEERVGPMFPGWHRDWISYFGEVVGRQAKVKGFGVHQLRKAVISNLLSEGVPVHIVQQISGHKDTSILMKHYAISTEEQAKGAAQSVSFK